MLDIMTKEIPSGVYVIAENDGGSSRVIERAPSNKDIDIPATRK
jgi:hypothetical protein